MDIKSEIMGVVASEGKGNIRSKVSIVLDVNKDKFNGRISLIEWLDELTTAY